MARWFFIIVIGVGLMGCSHSSAPAQDDFVNHDGDIPSFVLPTSPSSLAPTSPLITPDDEIEQPAPKKKMPKEKSPTDSGNSDPATDKWVAAEQETNETPPAPNTVDTPPPPAPPTLPPPPSAPFTTVSTDALSTDIDQGSIYVGDADATTAQRVDCPAGTIATGVSLIYSAQDEILGLKSLTCRTLLNDGNLGDSILVRKKLGATQIPPGGASTSMGCNGKRTDGIVDSWTVRYDNEFITRFDLHCKSLQALWYRAHIDWTVTFSHEKGIHELEKSQYATMTSDMYHQTCPDPDHHAIVSLHLRDNGQTDVTARLTGIGRVCATMLYSQNIPDATAPQSLKYFTGYFGGPVIHLKYTDTLPSDFGFGGMHTTMSGMGSWNDKPTTNTVSFDAGGSESAPLYCPPQSVAIGLFGRSGADIDALGLICRNRYSGDETRHGPIGGDGGGDFEQKCSHPDEILRGAHVHAGSWGDAGYVVKQIDIVCGSTETSIDFVAGENAVIVPMQHAITGLKLRSGARVDAMGFLYRRLPWYDSVRSDFSPGKMHTTEYAGGVGGGESIQRCPEGLVAIGLAGRSGSDIDAVGLVCQSMTLTDSEPWRSPIVGGDGGGAFEILCPAGLVLQGIAVGLDAEIAVELRLGCSQVQPHGTVAPQPEWPTTARIMGDYDSSNQRKPPTVGVPDDGNHVVTGLRIRSGDRVDAIGLLYHPVE